MTDDRSQDQPAESSEVLKEEAQELQKLLRERAFQEIQRPPGTVARACIAAVLLFSLGGGMVLLGSPDFRRVVVQWIAYRTFPGSDASARIFRLPPPPAEPAVAKVQSVVPAGVTSLEGEIEGVLYATIPGPEAPGPAAPSQEQPGFAAPSKTPDAEEAMQVLQELSSVMGKIVAGEDENFVFQEWRPVKVEPPRYWLDVIVKRSEDEQEVHLVFEVDLEARSFRPLSQAARDLRP